MKRSPSLYSMVIMGIILGIGIGILAPETAVSLKLLGDGFIRLIKMLIAPVIFCTVVTGIAKSGDLKTVGRVSGKALLYFEVVSSFALAIGLAVANIFRPGAHFNVSVFSLDSSAVAEYSHQAHRLNLGNLLFNMIPQSFIGSFTESGEVIQVLILAVFVGMAIKSQPAHGAAILRQIDSASHLLFWIVGLVMKLAPLGAGGAMAFTVGKYGLHSLLPLGQFMACFYLACLIFILVVLGCIGKAIGFNIFRLLVFLKDEILTVLGTSSSESVLVSLMHKLEQLGCPKTIVGLVVPTGYSFNLDGTNIYLTLAAVFIAQALNIDLSLKQQLALVVVAMITSKGASGVTGAGFVALAATLATVPELPVAGLTLILGVDRFMSEARAVTNLIGNSVATIVISKWEQNLDDRQLERSLVKS